MESALDIYVRWHRISDVYNIFDCLGDSGGGGGGGGGSGGGGSGDDHEQQR